ncbi:DnaJ domain-containing protein [Sphaerosporella brunnea]|uniref:DnaJ domain-containing protein n=1 Tax=Sphaerosporella brunnea TaxID=1250544 RepID=A0A5J5EGC0_9PEZI|nr:DnaJ domain-containing protein [Sphaerosporella brunnea]
MDSVKFDDALPVFSGEWPGENNFVFHAPITSPVNRKLEPLGPHFLAHARRKRHSRTFSEDDRLEASKKVKNIEEEDAGEISEPEDAGMLSRDAKDWKNQDHYAVLGLSKYRWRATDEQIKKAHRRKVLKHHPDKKAASSSGAHQDDSFFKCIQKAMEILSDPVKRRQYDSVDDNADVDPPSKKAKGLFYKLWAPVFAAEGRFSKQQPVPKLGNEKSTKEEVDEFYNFFYNFDSWRTFEYLDEDVPDDNENRDQKRYRKNEDIARLRELVDKALGLDPRIRIFKEQERERRNAKKNAREAEEKRLAEEAAKKAEEDAKKKAEEEAVAKASREAGKKAKEAAKQAVKKNRRVLKASVKDNNYFVTGDPSPATIDGVLGDVELIQGKIDPDELAELVSKLSVSKGADAVKAVYVDQAEALVNKGAAKKEDFKALFA